MQPYSKSLTKCGVCRITLLKKNLMRHFRSMHPGKCPSYLEHCISENVPKFPILKTIGKVTVKEQYTEIFHQDKTPLDTFRTDSDFVDVALSCEGRVFQAHKIILSASSAYFRNILKSLPFDYPVLILPSEVRADDLERLLRFIYAGEVQLDETCVSRFLKTGQMLEINSISTATQKAIDLHKPDRTKNTNREKRSLKKKIQEDEDSNTIHEEKSKSSTSGMSVANINKNASQNSCTDSVVNTEDPILEEVNTDCEDIHMKDEPMIDVVDCKIEPDFFEESSSILNEEKPWNFDNEVQEDISLETNSKTECMDSDRSISPVAGPSGVNQIPIGDEHVETTFDDSEYFPEKSQNPLPKGFRLPKDDYLYKKKNIAVKRLSSSKKNRTQFATSVWHSVGP